MPSYNDLTDRIKELAKLTTGARTPAIPNDVLGDGIEAITKLTSTLRKYFPPNPQEKKAAKAHSVSAQILTFTTMDANRKAFFNADYFRRKFQALPEDRTLVSSSTPSTAPTIRDAIILYYFRQGHAGRYDKLSAFWREIEADYKTSPGVLRTSQANEFLQGLLALPEEKSICEALLRMYPTEADLKEFAKITKLKIPAQSRAK